MVPIRPVLFNKRASYPIPRSEIGYISMRTAAILPIQLDSPNYPNRLPLHFERHERGIPVTEKIVSVRNAKSVFGRLHLPLHRADDAPLIAVEQRDFPCFTSGGLLQEELDSVLDSFGRGRGDENTGRILDEDLKAAGTSSAAREDRIGFK